jgi:hypothetical protein
MIRSILPRTGIAGEVDVVEGEVGIVGKVAEELVDAVEVVMIDVEALRAVVAIVRAGAAEEGLDGCASGDLRNLKLKEKQKKRVKERRRGYRRRRLRYWLAIMEWHTRGARCEFSFWSFLPARMKNFGTDAILSTLEATQTLKQLKANYSKPLSILRLSVKTTRRIRRR